MKSFFAKLLLFGEYGLMFGGRALAVPYPRYGGHFLKPAEKWIGQPEENLFRTSNRELERFVSWFAHEELNDRMFFPLKLDRLRKDIGEQLCFQSDIPPEYGIGSSGALCAALLYSYSSYPHALSLICRRHSLTEALKHDFVLMEAYFHGHSSGLDPLVSFLHQPVLFDNSRISLPRLPLNGERVSAYLLDTGQPGATTSLLSLFLEKMENPDFRDRFRGEYMPANDGAIQSFLGGEQDSLFGYLQRISRFQLNQLPEMIPAGYVLTMQKLLEQGIPVKLLGSGGGGYLLAFAHAGKDCVLPDRCLKVF
ncbi:MAG: hypothetical protein AB7D05_02795 [Mangrovibacterium sp.]